MKRLFSLILAFLPLSPMAQAAEGPKVAVSIRPLHSLIAGIMQGVAEPDLLVRGGASPHGYALRPSDAKVLSRAGSVVWIGPDMTPLLEKPLRPSSLNTHVLELGTIAGIATLAAETGGGINPHLWLDPANAQAVVAVVASILADMDPGRASLYHRNAARLRDRLYVLDGELRELLEPVYRVPFMVYHDAYAYLTRTYDLNQVGSLAADPERPPGARRLVRARNLLRKEKVRCLFLDPHAPVRLAESVVSGLKTRIQILDPLGSGLKPGPKMYFELMENLARAMVRCLAPTDGG